MRTLRHHSAVILLLGAALVLAGPMSAEPVLAQPAPPQPTPTQPPYPPPGPPIPTLPAVPGVAAAAPPLALGDALTRALQQNFQVRQAALQVLIARAQLQQAQAGVLPTLGFQGSYTGTSPSGGTATLGGTISIPGAPGGAITNQPFTAQVPSNTTPPWSFKLLLSYPLYSGNALQDQIAIAQANVRVAEAGFVVTSQQTVLSVRQAYYNVQLTQGVVAAQQRSVAAAQENVRVTDARVRAGTAPRFDLLQAQVQLAQAQQALTTAKTNAVQAQQSLSALLDVPLDTTVSPETPLGLTPPSDDLDVFIQQALRARPELAQVRASEDAAQAAIDLAGAGLRPNFTISGGPGIQTTDPGSNLPVVWTGTLLMTIAIFDGGLTGAKVEGARQQLAQDKVIEEQTRQSVELDVRNAYLGLQNAAEQLRSAQAALDAAREAVRIANVRYQAGVGTQLEVVTAEQNLASADVGVVQGLFSYNLALAQLDRAVGAQVKL
jgi:outer membrane protein